MKDYLSKEDENLLKYTIEKRKKIIEKLMTDNELPKNKEQLSLLSSALDGIDKNIISQARLRLQDKANQIEDEKTMVVSHILSSLSEKKYIEENIKNKTIRLPKDKQSKNIQDGELEIGQIELNYESFMENMEKNEK